MIKRILSLTICVVFILVGIPFNTFVSAEECEHDYGDWGITIEATCTQDGKEIKVCNLCGNTETVITKAATGHSFGEWKTKTEATCINEGIEARDCSKCESEETRVVKVDHSFQEGICTGCGILLGDLNINNTIDMIDLILLKTELLSSTVTYNSVSDIDVNGEVSASDFTALRKMVFESF